jgi:Uma2 family endonuclease
MTAEELLDMPDDGFRYELVRGELRKMPLRGMAEGSAATEIGLSLWRHVEANSLGLLYMAPTGFTLATDPNHVRVPAVGFVSGQRPVHPAEPNGYLRDSFVQRAPDLAVETVSFIDPHYDLDEKIADWLDAGTRAVVVVNPRRRTVNLHRLTTGVVTLMEADVLAVDDVVPGWQMPVMEIFE